MIRQCNISQTNDALTICQQYANMSMIHLQSIHDASIIYQWDINDALISHQRHITNVSKDYVTNTTMIHQQYVNTRGASSFKSCLSCSSSSFIKRPSALNQCTNPLSNCRVLDVDPHVRSSHCWVKSPVVSIDLNLAKASWLWLTCNNPWQTPDGFCSGVCSEHRGQVVPVPAVGNINI